MRTIRWKVSGWLFRLGEWVSPLPEGFVHVINRTDRKATVTLAPLSSDESG